MRIDPANTDEVAAALRAYVAGHLGVADACLAERPERIGHGFDTYIYSFRLESQALAAGWERPLVLRLYAGEGDGAKAEREAAVQRFVTSRGYPALEPLAVETHASGFGLPLMIMERAPGVPMLERLGLNPRAVRRQFAAMADLHAALHRMPVEGCPLVSDEPLVERRLAEFRERLQHIDNDELQRGMRWLEQRKQTAVVEEPSVCHNDFHPLNILVADDGRMTVLDWSDAAVGDRLHDVARTLALFRFAWIAAESSLERIVLRLARGFLAGSYLGPYRRQLPFDEERLRYWLALQTFSAWLQLEELSAIDDLAAEGVRADSVQRLPTGLRAQLRQYFQTFTKAS